MIDERQHMTDTEIPEPPAGGEEEAARAALAARVRPQEQSAEEMLRAAHSEAIGSLADLRQQRDALNDAIREMVAEEDLLRRAVAVFDRAHRA